MSDYTDRIRTEGDAALLAAATMANRHRAERQRFSDTAEAVRLAHLNPDPSTLSQRADAHFKQLDADKAGRR